MKRPISMAVAIASAAAAMSLAAADTPLWMRDVKISPDGTTIAFRYRGDIYTVPASGGTARRITTTEAMETTPIWSPDSRSIAFASDRDGAMNIYIADARGGAALPVTAGSLNLTPEAFTPDGAAIVYSAAIQDPASSRLFPSARLTELYSVPVSGGASTQLLASPAEMPSWLPDGKSFLYHDQKGMENKWRKHHTSSVTRDVWKYDAATGRHTNLTAHAGEDRNPVLSPDGSTVYFLSERDGGSMNVYAMSLANTAEVRPVSRMLTHPVRFLSISDDGLLAYGYDGAIYTQRDGSEPQRIAVEIVDDPVEKTAILPVSKFTEGTPSADGKEVALVSRGNIFVASTEFGTTRQVTDNANVQKNVAWHPEGRKIAFTSDRDGAWDIYEASIKADDEPGFANATIIDVKRIPGKADGERSTPQYSPDGKKLAYVADRAAINVVDLASGKVTQITDGSGISYRSDDVEYEWSPDSKWIVTTVVDNRHDPYYDVALVEVATGKTTNLTASGYFDYKPSFAYDGNAVLFYSDRRGMRSHASWGSQGDVYAIFLNQDALDRYRLDEEQYKLLADAEKKAKEKAEKGTKPSGKDKKKKGDKKKDAGKDAPADKGPKDIVVELDGLQDRLVRLTPNSSNISDFAVVGEPGSEVLYYLSSFEEGYDLWKRDLRKGDASIVNKLDAGPSTLATADGGKKLFVIGHSGVKHLNASDERVKSVPVKGSAKLQPAREREAMFDYAVREEGKRFYRTDMHGTDWQGLAAHYRAFLPYISNNYDFAEMLSELLGELNVSHTGSSYYPDGSQEPSAELGVLFDMAYTGPGMKVAEILPGTPFARASSKVRPGHLILAVQSDTISPRQPLNLLLKRMAGKPVLVDIFDPATGKHWAETVRPISRSAMNGKLYTRWVERNRQLVDSLSGGRLGYVHLKAMDDHSFREIYKDMFGRYYDRDGIIIDTRWNGGGRLHEDIEVLLSGDKYFTQVVRGKPTGEMPSRRWNKPSIMIQGEANYSNAHGTPWVYKHKELGKLVGAPVPGTMTSVNWVTLRDPSLVFGIPVTGMQIADGSYLENQQLEPDILILNDPAEVVNGRDAQIEAAVASLLGSLDD